MRIIGKVGGAGRSFASDRRGNFAIATAAVSAVLLLAIGYGVNTAQLYHVKTNLRSAMDAAVTSTARDLTTGRISEKDAPGIVDAFLQANGNFGFASQETLTLDRVVIDRTAKTVTADAHVDVALLFPLFADQNNTRIALETAAVYSDKQIEVAMMLDITGSMAKKGKKDKIGDLQAAARNAVDLLLDGQDKDNPRVRVAIVPYAEAVNTGKLSGAVFAEQKGGSDLPPPNAAAKPAAFTSAADHCATERKLPGGAADFSDDGPFTERFDKKGNVYFAKVNRDDRLDVCPKAELVALTANKQKLLDTIDDFRANGVTAGGIAAQWGYYMLSPQWRSAVKDAGMGDGAAKFDPRKVAKVAILMTDGQFNTAFAGVKDGDTPQNRQGEKSRSYAESLCANMRHDGIDIYTIGFDLGAGEKDEARGVLKNCASPDSGDIRHFFDVSTGAELDAAFKEIIRNTERLALTK